MAATVVNSIILSVVLWKLVSHTILTTWLACILLITISRYILVLSYRRTSKEERINYPWVRWFIVGVAISGAAWGSAAIFIFPLQSTAHQVFIAFVLGGMVAGSVAAFSVVMGAFLGFSIPVLFPLIIRFFIQGGDLGIAMGAMITLFLFLMVATARRLHSETLVSINLRFENLDLVSHLNSSKENLEKAQEIALLGNWEWNIISNSVAWSQQTYRIFGYEPGEITPSYDLFHSLVHPGDRETLFSAIDRTLKENVPFDTQYRITRKDGTERIIHSQGELCFDGDNRPIKIFGTNHDITDIKRSEETISNIARGVSAETGDEFFRTLVQYLANNLGVAFAFIGELSGDANDRIKTIALYALGSRKDNFEYDLKDTPCNNVVGKNLCTYAHNVRQEFPRDYMLVEMGIESYSGTPLFASNGDPLGLLVIMDVKPLKNIVTTESILQIFAIRAAAELERKRAEEELRASEIKYRTLMDNASDAIGIIDIDGTILEVNRQMEKLTGYTKDELKGRKFPTLLPKSAAERAFKSFKRVADGETEPLFEGAVTRKNGTEVPIEGKSTVVEYEGRRAMQSIIRDITERKRAEEAIIQQRDFLDTLHNSIAEPVFTIKMPEGIIVHVNRSVGAVFGYKPEECIGKKISLFHSDMESYIEYGRVLKAAHQKGKASHRSELLAKRKNGEIFPCEITSSFIRENEKLTKIISILKDITERKIAEKKLSQNFNLLNSITGAQLQFIADAPHDAVFDDLLKTLLDLTNSEYGFIGEILYKDDGTPYLKTHATTNIAWDEETRKFYEKHAPTGLEFNNLKTLFGAVITSGEKVISNSPSTDPRSGGLPDGHPPLNAFMGLPFHKGGRLEGMIGVANRPGGYDEELAEYLKPFLATCASLMEAYKIEKKRTQTEKELEYSEEKWHFMLKGSMDGIVALDADTRITVASKGFEKMFGYSTEELIGQPLQLLVPEGKMDEARNILKEVREKGFVSNYITQRKHKNGSLVDVDLTVTSLGKTGSMGIIRDITKRKQAEDAIENIAKGVSAETGDEFFRSLVRYLAENLESAYAFAGELTGEAKDSIKTIAVCVDGEIKDNFTYALAGTPCRNVVGKAICTYPANVQRDFPKDTMLVEMGVESYIGSPLFDSKGNALGLLVVMDRKPLQNRTMAESMLQIFSARASAELERKRTENALKEAKMTAEKANEAKTRFVAKTNHELRNPLTSMISMLKLIVSGMCESREQEKEFLKNVYNSSIHLRGVIEHLLDLSVIESGKLKINMRSVRFINLLELVRQITWIQAKEKGLKLVFNCRCTEDNRMVYCDPDRLRELLVNLVNNAIKFTEKGSVSVTCKVSKDKDMMTLKITDTGIGIEPEQLKEVFHPFVQAEGNLHGGSGLGLTLAKKLVQAMGGAISIESKGLGHGTMVTILLPQTPVRQADSKLRHSREKTL